jgi:hypothetical protein
MLEGPKQHPRIEGPKQVKMIEGPKTGQQKSPARNAKQKPVGLITQGAASNAPRIKG